MKHLGDITKLNGAEIPVVDVITGGSPCQDLSVAGLRKGMKHEANGDDETTRSGLFMDQVRIVKEMRQRDRENGRTDVDVRPRYMVWENVCFAAGTLVTCEDGYKPIEKIAVGDKVKTASGIYCPVAKTHKNKNQTVMRLCVSGAEDVVVTPNHPFLVREKTYPFGAANRGRLINDARWECASNLTSDFLIAYRIDIPTLPNDFITEAEAWAIGRWLADGSVDLTKSNPRIFISCGLKKVEETRKMLSGLPYEIHENKPHETAVNFCFTSREFYSLIASAGIGAGNKRVPPFVFGLPYKLQKCVLGGYISGDGIVRNRGRSTELQANTASRELAYGICRLLRNVYKVSANISVTPPKDGVIGDRILHANYPSYGINACLTSISSPSFADSEFVWQPVKSIEYLEEKQTVYNLSVIGDNTYGANDIVVHNCGAFSSNEGKDFQAVLTEIVRIIEPTAPDVPMPDKGWPYAGCIYGEMGNWSIAYRVHDAQYWGVPQRRKRLALVADFNGLTAPEILFDPQLRGEAESSEPDQTFRNPSAGNRPEVPPVCDSLQGHSDESGTAGEGTAESTSGRSDGTGEGL